ncbi:MAG: NADPH:quinone oxidoreductase family protein [Pseudomonadota bacterium]
MKALLSESPGGPETLAVKEMPTPTPGPGEVLIGVKAAGVNFPDTLIIRDLYQIRPERPFAPGSESAGVIEAVGENVTDFNVGDRVQALTMFGGFATHLVVDQSSVQKIPGAMPFDEAAGFIFTYGTSYYALIDRGDLKAGETVLILGAAGGIGVSTIEVGKALGARVIAAVSSEEKAEFCRSVGADEVVLYPLEMDRSAQKDFANAVKKIAGPDGVNVVYDAVGGDYAEPALRTLGWEGRFLVVGFPAGIPSLPLNLTLLKSCQVIGVFWGAFIKREQDRYAEHLKALFSLYNEGKLKPRITARYPLQKAADALRDIETRKAMGKIVLTVD